MYPHTLTHSYTDIHQHSHTHTYAYTHTHTHSHVHPSTHTERETHTCTQTHILCTCTYTHMHTHTHKHTNMHSHIVLYINRTRAIFSLQNKNSWCLKTRELTVHGIVMFENTPSRPPRTAHAMVRLCKTVRKTHQSSNP